MLRRRLTSAAISLCLFAITMTGCSGGGTTSPTSALPALAQIASAPEGDAITSRATTLATAAIVNRSGFVGAFYRPQGSPPFGIFAPQANGVAPQPYPSKTGTMLGNAGYCDALSGNGASIDGAFPVDVQKLNNLIFLGARWSRMPAPSFAVDTSHVFGAGNYAFASLDAAQCISFLYHNIKPVINLEAGPVQYNSTPGKFSPQMVSTYKTADDFGEWCGVVAKHEHEVFPAVSQFSIPGNEVNSNPQLFPGGEPQIAAYSKACYAAIKAANPNTFVYGFELNMDGSLNAPAFVKRMAALGCKAGTCYDGISMHLTLRYPIPPPSTPCYPNPGGDYSMQCVTDIETVSQTAHVLISETVYTVPGSVPNEQAKADASVAEFRAFAANPTIDGALYANVDECASYPSGYFANGCLVDTSGNHLPAWNALQWFVYQHLI